MSPNSVCIRLEEFILTKIALISDIHGNLTALEAVFADIEKRGVDYVFCLADCCFVFKVIMGH